MKKIITILISAFILIGISCGQATKTQAKTANNEIITETSNGIIDSQNDMKPYFFVFDTDGYVNVRNSPTTQSDIVCKLYNKSIVEISSSENDWMFVKGGNIIGFDENGHATFSEDGYIHKSRLIPLSKGIIDSTRTARDKFFSNGRLRPIYVLHKDIPHIIFFSDDDCELSIRDLSLGEELYYTCVPVCAHIHTESDTLWISEQGWMGGSYEDGKYGIIADYKIIHEDNLFNMVCTRFYPIIPKMSKEETEKVLTDKRFEGIGIKAYWLFVAYCNGNEKAKEILINSDNFGLDGAGWHEYSDVISLLNAYESNLNWQKNSLNEKNKK